MKKYIAEITIVAFLLLILGIFLNPTELLMPDSINKMLVLAMMLGFFAFVALIWKENPKDEREILNSYKTGRLAFLTGAAILFVAVSVQASMHAIDPWLIYALISMLLVKIITIVLDNFKN